MISLPVPSISLCIQLLQHECKYCFDSIGSQAVTQGLPSITKHCNGDPRSSTEAQGSRYSRYNTYVFALWRQSQLNEEYAMPPAILHQLSLLRSPCYWEEIIKHFIGAGQLVAPIDVCRRIDEPELLT